MMKSKAEIRREIEKAVSSYTANDLFSSSYFEEMMQATITSVCERLGRIPRVYCECDIKSDLTAATDGLNIHINTLGPLVRYMDTNWKIYVGNIGHVVHESGHVLFTDFANQNTMIKGWIKDKVFNFYPKIPCVDGTEDVVSQMRAYPNLRMAYSRYMKGIVNGLEDAYIENLLRDNFDGLATAGLSIVNLEMYKNSQSLEILLQAALEGKCLPIQIADSILLTRYVVGKEPKMGNLSSEQQNLLDCIEAVLKNAKTETDMLAAKCDGLARCDLFNTLFVKLFPLMQMSLSKEDESTESVGGDSSQEDFLDGMTADALKDLLSRADAFDVEIGKSQEPRGNTSSLSFGTAIDSEEKKEVANALAESEQSMQRELMQAIKRAAAEEVTQKEEKLHEETLSNEAEEIENNLSSVLRITSFKGYRLTRAALDKNTYQCIYSDVARSSRNLVRRINNILNERETDSMQSGFLMGQRFNARDLVNHDGKYFSRQFVPDGRPEVAFGILIDESGSMYTNSKFERARKVAILLEDALRNLDVSLLIAGHNEEGNGDCTLCIYKDFDTYDGKDRYRLPQINAKGGNIDGAAISYMGEKLMKRSEKIKVLIVISDGLPAGSSFYDNNANEDTKKAIASYRKKGIKVFGAVVDSFDEVAELYGKDSCFDCRKNDELEKQLIRLIKRFVLIKC